MNSDLDLWKDIQSKIIFILRKPKEENKSDDKLKKIIHIVYKIMSRDESFKTGKNVNIEFFFSFINLIYTLFKLEKEEREKILKTNVSCIKNKDVLEKIQGLDKTQIVKETIKNKLIAYLCEIILSYLKKEKYSLIEYIDATIGNMLYIPNMNMILKYEIYSLIMQEYFYDFFKEIIDFEETQINSEDDISIEMIIDLFENDKQDKIKAFQALIILKYESLRDSIIKYNINQINEALKKTLIKIENEPNISPAIYYEKIILIFKEELEELIQKKKRRKKKKKSKISNNNEQNNDNANEIKEGKNIKSKFRIYDYVPKKIENKQSIPVNKNEIINIKTEFEELNDVNIINYKEFDNDIALNKGNDNNINFGDNIKSNIIEFLNKIIDMDKKEDRLNCISQLENIIFKYIDAIQKETDSLKEQNKNITLVNDNLVKKIDSLKEEIDSSKKEIDSSKKEIDSLKEFNKNITLVNDNLNKEIDNMKIRIEKLENKNEEVTDILGTIHIRDLGKNFLRTFNKYLTFEDFQLIKKDYSKKGQIIAKRIKKTFAIYSKSQKMDIIINLILTAFNSLNEGNHFAHSILADNFEDDIEEYKNKKKMKSINSPEIIIFLLGLGIEENYFDNSLQFLMTFFNENLNLKKNSDFLETYFK